MAEVIEFSRRVVATARPEAGNRAFGLSDQAEERLFLVFRDPEHYLILRYADLESIGPVPGIPANRAVLMRFTGSVTRDVRIEGGQLLDVVNPLRWRRVAWLEESPEGWAGGDGATVSISRILVREVRG